ncbi:MAG: rab-GTPase-TBC domain-containing protein [Benjaminiella poitrasii]|nr:MAG: rab-GTPase-TBC domain-containing protein [Benjaminiella poitrasii]
MSDEMTMTETNDENTIEDSNKDFDSIDLSKSLSSTHLSSTAENLTADKLLNELPLPQRQQSLYNHHLSSRTNNSNYDQFFEEVSLDLPRDKIEESGNNQSSSPSSRLMKLMPRRMNSNNKSNTNITHGSLNDENISTNNMKITSSDISGPFYSISDVLLDDNVSHTANNNLSNAAAIAASSTISSNHIGNNGMGISNPLAARRNVNEADVVVTAGGTSLPVQRRSSLNLFRRSKSINQKPTPLESVISKTRPRMLPPKDPQEEKKHLQEYEMMMKKARKMEAKKQKEMDRKKEEKDKKMNYAIYIWENEIIPNWKKTLKERRTIALWDQGIPPRCRKKAWRLRIGNQLNITKATFAESMHRLPLPHQTKSDNSYYQSHGAPMPIVTNEANNHTKIYGHNEPSLYNIRRQRRTSSLDVLRETEGVTSTTNTTEDEADDENDKVNIITTHPQFSSSSYSFATTTNSSDVSSQHEDQQSNHPNPIIDTDENESYNDIMSSPGEEEDPDLTLPEDERQKMLMDKDPIMINFLNKAIDEDILRTLPSLCVFQPEGPLFNSLRKVLHAYVGYTPNMTYPRGTSFLAGVLLLNMNTQDTFIALVNLIQKSEVLSALYNNNDTNTNEKKIQGFFKIFNVIFAENLPKLYLHFKNLALTPENYLPDWFMTVFASIIPLELSSRLWDTFLLHGDIILFRTALVVLKYLEPLLWGGGFSETVKILNMGFVGEHRGEEVKAALAVSGHITEGDEDPFFDEILGRRGVYLDTTRFKELLGAHMPRTM